MMKASRMIWRHKQLFNALWANFEIVARTAFDAGNYIAIEWPRGCSYWNLPKVKNLCKELNLSFADFDGCMFGMTSHKNKTPIMKPWRIATNSPELHSAFNGRFCCGHKEHAPCAGKDTKLTENYTDAMVTQIHSSWKRQINKAPCSKQSCPRKA